MESCAVVGNSGILLKNNYGNMIDKSDIIFRINYAPVGGKYHPFVGSKTHFDIANRENCKRMYGICPQYFALVFF